MGIRGSNGADYLKARIKRDAPHIYERLDSYPNVRAAALDAGIVKPTITIPIDPAAAVRRICKHFTHEQFIEMIALMHEHEKEQHQ